LQQVEASEQSTTWNREIQAYKRLNSIHHQHIVRLLATYLQDERLHMIFPWADGNLFQFWKERFPDRSYPPRDHKLARWMLKQFVGLAEALQSIHNYKISSAQDDLQMEAHKRTHGRHGDLKPENILCFRSTASDSQEDTFGTLMISDLGSTEFHGTLSKVVETNAAGGFTETYKAPEFDFMKQVSPESDIWSFGCVLFQFIVWYMLGWSGVEAFAQARTEDSNFVIRMDHFFNFFKHENSVEAKASVRKVGVFLGCRERNMLTYNVKEFQKLRDGTDTSDFILALLDVLESAMLRLRFDQRASCDEIVKQLLHIKNLCDRDSTYCTERTRKFDFKARVPTGLSEKVSVPLSEEMRAEYIRNIDPNLYLVNTQSVKPRSARSVGDDSESRDTRSFTRHISFRSTQPSTSAAGRQELQVDTSGLSLGPGQGEQHPNILRRVMTRIKNIIMGCLPWKGNR
jgi:serine/threonine protein kinase